MKRRSLFVSFFLFVVLFPSLASAQNTIPPNVERIHYHRFDNNYAGWTVYAFNDTTEDTGNFNGGPVPLTGTDSFGGYFDVGLKFNAQNPASILPLTPPKHPGPNHP